MPKAVEAYDSREILCSSGRLNELVNSFSGSVNARAKIDRFTPSERVMQHNPRSSFALQIRYRLESIGSTCDVKAQTPADSRETAFSETGNRFRPRSENRTLQELAPWRFSAKGGG